MWFRWDEYQWNKWLGLHHHRFLQLKTDKIVIRPLPGFPVIRDLVVDMSQFYQQYERIEPYLQNDDVPPAQERLQSPEERAQLDGFI